ncbi:hypothetical protein HK405_006769, partial [Cladochytrium tenue]
MTAMSITTLAPEPQPPPPLSAGQALARLLAAAEPALRSAADAHLSKFKSPNGGLLAAFQGLDDHIRRNGPQGLRDVYDPVAEKVLKANNNNPERRRAIAVSVWLLRSEHGTSLCSLVAAHLSDSGDSAASARRAKLAAAQLIAAWCAAAATSRITPHTPRAATASTAAAPLPWQLRLAPLAAPLLGVAEADGVFDEARRVRRMSRLTGVALGAAVDILGMLAALEVPPPPQQQIPARTVQLVAELGGGTDAGASERQGLPRDVVAVMVRALECMQMVRVHNMLLEPFAFLTILDSSSPTSLNPQYRDDQPVFMAACQNAAAFLAALESSESALVRALVPKVWTGLVRGAHPAVSFMPLERLRAMLVKALDAPLDDVVHEAVDVYIKLATACFALGQRPREDVQAVLSDAPEVEKSLTVLTASGPERVKPVVEDLLTMLDDDGGGGEGSAEVSPMAAIAGVLAEYVAFDPHTVLFGVFERLGAGEPHRRANAATVLDAVFAVQRERLFGSAGLDTRLRDALARHLLERLGDEHIEIRSKAAVLFSNT